MKHRLVTLAVGLCTACELGGAVGIALDAGDAGTGGVPADSVSAVDEGVPPQGPLPPQQEEPQDAGTAVADDAGEVARAPGPPTADDQCPEGALKTTPGACGCDVSDRDLDGDATVDCDDELVVAPLPYASGAAASAVLSDGLHYLGGSSDFYGDTRYAAHYVYDAGTGQWSDAPANIPDTDTWGARAHVHQDRLYLVGGYPAANRLRVYDPATNSWTTLEAPPVEVNWGFASGIIGDAIYTFGGEPHSDRNAPGRRYDIATNRWTAVADIPLNYRIGPFATAVVGSRMFVLNGNDDEDETVMQIYDAATDRWSQGRVLDGHLFEAAAAVPDGDRVLFFGGSADQDISDFSDEPAVLTNQVNVYDTVTDGWSTAPPLSGARMWATAQLFQGRFYVLGGLDAASDQLSDYEVHTP